MKAGLCDTCRHQKLVRNTRGSTFSMCERSKTDERFPKYPRLPVERCPGWERREDVRPELPRPRSRYAWLAGILVFMGLGVLVFAQTLPNGGEAAQGPDPGQRLPAFAAPAASGNVEDDAANVCQGEPCPDGAGPLPACDIDSQAVVTVCPRRRRPLVLTFVVARGTDCEPQVDRAERVRRQLPGVDFVAVVSGDTREEAENLARARGWSQMVAVDEDGAVVDLYGVGICPVTVFADGGRVRETRLGNLTEEQLRRGAQRLASGSVAPQ